MPNKKTTLVFLLIFINFTAPCFSQQNYWQQQVNYTIDVSLNDKEHTLTGFEKIEYTNNSPDTLHFIWFHLWPNAHKNDKTAYSDQALENGSTKFYFSNKEDKGYINRMEFKVNNVMAVVEDHPNHIDIIKLILPAPLPPGESINITTPFHVKLPHNFSRGGHDGESYQITQWYPKPAVYDRNGWHPMTYLDQGEFYSEFGEFNVNITLPENYVVAATGELQNQGEKEWLKTRNNYSWEPVSGKEKNNYGQTKTTLQPFPNSSTKTKTLQYRQNNIHDFAWFADKRFIVNYDTCKLASGKTIDVYSYYTASHKKLWSASVANAKDAIHHYSNLVGEYPYSIVSVVQGPDNFGGGMEYPTITSISPTHNAKSLDIVIAHEIGHNWFYGILGTNERKHPWMDEGINSYYDAIYKRAKYGEYPKLEQLAFETKAIYKTDQPIELPAEKYSYINYTLSAYYKTAEWLRYLELQIGSTAFNKAIQDYYNRWQYKHPQPDDFKKSLEESVGKNLDAEFSYLNKKGILPTQQRNGTAVSSIFNIKKMASFTRNPTKNLLVFGPLLGVNSYDKLMPGAFISNIKFPPSRFEFFAAPMYSTGAKKITGTAFAKLNFYPDNIFKKIELGINGSSFTMDEFTDNDGNKNNFGFRKIVPGIKFILNEKNPRSTFHRFIQFKTFLITEEALRFYRDTVITLPGPDTTITNKYRTINENSTLNQLQLIVENNRVLYPYRGELKIEQGKDFLRTAFTGKYFFNYPKRGGLGVRLFAGKFFYTSSKTFTKQFATDRYHLNMTGANGYEDYTYSDYFIGRNKFEGTASQQIMVRDGAFKVRTNLLADKVGRTDDWLIAANFSTTIPSAINPLELLPLKIPVKLFFDIGTYAEAWKQSGELDRFIFDAGLHIPLFKETVNIYMPIVYSSIFKDYIQSTIPEKGRFWKKISFSIDISNFNLRKIDRNIAF